MRSTGSQNLKTTKSSYNTDDKINTLNKESMLKTESSLLSLKEWQRIDLATAGDKQELSHHLYWCGWLAPPKRQGLDRSSLELSTRKSESDWEARGDEGSRGWAESNP